MTSLTRRSQNLRLSRAVELSGVLADVCCDYCLSSDRVCIVSPISNRCSECLARNQGRSHSSASVSLSSLAELESLILQESSTRAELTLALHSLNDCFARLNNIIARREALLSTFVQTR